MPPQDPPLPGWMQGLPGRADARTHPARPLPRGVSGRGRGGAAVENWH